MLLVAVLSAGTGAAAGYTVANGSQRPSQESSIGSVGPPVHYLSSTTPSALGGYPHRQNQYDPPDYNPSPRYILRTDQGFVTVFYVQNAQDQSITIKERTRTPTCALSPEERQRLSDGIYIYTEEQLIRLLQDYDS